MKPAILCTFLILTFSQPLIVLGQQQVHGTVIDAATREPMPFVTIAVVGSTYGTISNQNGEFTLNTDKISPTDSIAFHYLGYETITMRVGGLEDGMIVKIREKPFSLKAITIVANPMSPEELIKKAIERKAANYAQIAQKREVFSRSNRASYITGFDLSLKKSDIPEVDKILVKEMVDSLPQYSRSYEDYLYTLYTLPGDSAKSKNKVEGIKNVVLREDNGGGRERISSIIDGLFVNKKDSNTFWKYRTGLFSFREDNIRISGSASDSTKKDPLFTLYFLNGDLSWGWDFIQKTNRYQYQNKGIIGIGGEDAWAISFRGKAGADYQGMIYISTESYAILRLDYSLKERKKDQGFDMLGVSFSEDNKAGLVIWEKDKLGYFLKYSMTSSTIRYGVDRSFDIIRKQKRPVFNKKVNEASLRMNLNGRQEDCYETLVVYRESSTEAAFRKVQEKGVRAERITSYSDEIWKGYSIIEPTRQMKEYQVKVRLP